mgnify:CR=1 FL=1
MERCLGENSGLERCFREDSGLECCWRWQDTRLELVYCSFWWKDAFLECSNRKDALLEYWQDSSLVKLQSSWFNCCWLECCPHTGLVQ